MSHSTLRFSRKALQSWNLNMVATPANHLWIKKPQVGPDKATLKRRRMLASCLKILLSLMVLSSIKYERDT